MKNKIKITTKIGLMHSCVLRSLLFSVVINEDIKEIKNKMRKLGYIILKIYIILKKKTDLMFADGR